MTKDKLFSLYSKMVGLPQGNIVHFGFNNSMNGDEQGCIVLSIISLFCSLATVLVLTGNGNNLGM